MENLTVAYYLGILRRALPEEAKDMPNHMKVKGDFASLGDERLTAAFIAASQLGLGDIPEILTRRLKDVVGYRADAVKARLLYEALPGNELVLTLKLEENDVRLILAKRVQSAGLSVILTFDPITLVPAFVQIQMLSYTSLSWDNTITHSILFLEPDGSSLGKSLSNGYLCRISPTPCPWQKVVQAMFTTGVREEVYLEKLFSEE
jgi:hypothetical protein